MSYSLIISDLHLDEDHPERSQLFQSFLHRQSYEADSLYILGDLFEMWVGEDYIPEAYQAAILAMQKVAANGTKTYFIPGNRDFLIGEGFGHLSGCKVLAEPHRVSLHGIPYLIMHGDTLCTDDREYQEFRARVRTDEWRENFFKQSLDQRLALVRSLRKLSQQTNQQKKAALMDVNQRAVEKSFKGAQGVSHMVHGHTHKAGVHHFILNGHAATRIVLGDWQTQGSFLRCDQNGYELMTYDQRDGDRR